MCFFIANTHWVSFEKRAAAMESLQYDIYSYHGVFKLMKAFSLCVFSHVAAAVLLFELMSNHSEDGHHSPLQSSLGWESLDESNQYQ